MIDRLDDTIVAISSAPGRAPVGIVRLSGPQAGSIITGMLVGGADHKAADLPGSRRLCTELVLGDGLHLPAVVHLFRAPRSSTRQDMAEILTIGSPPVLEMVCKRCLALGARPAEAGEFTARAFLNGALSLAQAEAVTGLISAQSDAQLRAARRLRDGALTQAATSARDELARILALVEAGIDFVDEPIEFISPAELHRDLRNIVERLDELARSSVTQERLDAVPTVLLAGAPNAGKSTLLNALTGTSRAICAAVAGTTRDILSAPMRWSTGEALLLDSAGIDASTDEVLSLARSRALETLTKVDLCLLVVDATAECPRDLVARLQSERPRDVLAVGSKLDLLDPASRFEVGSRLESLGFGRPCVVSACTGEGIEELRDTIAARFADRAYTMHGEALVLSARQMEAIREAGAAASRAINLAASCDTTADRAEFLAFELREALDAIGAVTGEVTTEDLLGEVFSRFCIGK